MRRHRRDFHWVRAGSRAEADVVKWQTSWDDRGIRMAAKLLVDPKIGVIARIFLSSEQGVKGDSFDRSCGWSVLQGLGRARTHRMQG
jgi:hypothetical protein